MRFGLEGGKSVILDRVQATTDGPIILKQHAITFDRSADLQKATNNSCVAEQPGMQHCPTCRPALLEVRHDILDISIRLALVGLISMSC